jgi:hypothetical protein
MRADHVARFDEVALEQTGEHRLGHHASADDPEPHPLEAFRTHVTPHLTAIHSPTGSASRAMIERDE